VGNLVIPAKHQKRDVMRGTDIDLEFEMSESRELKVKACVTSFGQEYGDVFRPGFREVRAKTLRGEVELLKSRVEQEKAEAISNENYEAAQQLEKLRVPIQGLYAEVMQLASYKDDDDVTDDRYKLDDRKRKLAQELDQMTAGKQLDRLRSEYETAKDETADIVNESGNDSERRQLNEVISQELTFVNSPNPQKLQERIAQLRRIGFGILRRTPDFQIGWFEHLKSKPEVFNDPLQAKNLIEAGKRHIVAEDYDRLEEVNLLLHRLLPEKDQDSDELRPFSVGLRG
jgi:molecular chaperone DnaK